MLFPRYWEYARVDPTLACEISVNHCYAFCKGSAAHRSRASRPRHNVPSTRYVKYNRHELRNACFYRDVESRSRLHNLMRGKRSAGEGLLSDDWIRIADCLSRRTTSDVTL